MSRPTRSPRSSSAKLAHPAPAGQLTWSHLGHRYRVTAWPEAAFEGAGENDTWTAVEPGEDVLASGAVALTRAQWNAFLDFVPSAERDFLEAFRFGRLGALLVITRAPQLLSDLAETPALTSYLVAHARLRGSPGAQWAELDAVHERGGLFRVLEWLGLPATRATLGVLRNLVDADIPRRLLEPLRLRLWQPAAATLLQHAPALSDRQLAHFCHALAA